MQQGNTSRLSTQQMETLSRLKQWLYSGGAHYDGLDVVYFSQHYRGVIATKPIKKEEIIVFIPKEKLITLEMAREDPICLQLIAQKVEIISPKHTYLAIFLLQEFMKQKESPWFLYLDILPKDHSSFPINYSNEELVELIGSPFLMQIHEKVYDLKRDYDAVFAHSQTFRKYKFRDFCWARTIVGSRIFGLFINEVKTDILAPFADMLNHRLPKQTSWNYIDQKQGFVIQSLEDIPQGVQVFDSYGKKCNSRYLLNYGYVIDNNPENQICIKAAIDGDLKAKKLAMLKRTEGITKVMKLSANLNESSFYEAMGFLRFKAITDFNHLAVLEKISGIKISNEAYVPTKTPPINMQLEAKIWEILKELCLNALKEYQTTLEEDLQLLKKPNLAYNMKNILVLRSGQKGVLNRLIGYADQLTPILKQGYSSAYDTLIVSQQKPWAKYLAKILSIMPGEKQKVVSPSLVVAPEEDDNEECEEELQNN